MNFALEEHGVCFQPCGHWCLALLSVCAWLVLCTAACCTLVRTAAWLGLMHAFCLTHLSFTIGHSCHFIVFAVCRVTHNLGSSVHLTASCANTEVGSTVRSNSCEKAVSFVLQCRVHIGVTASSVYVGPWIGFNALGRRLTISLK